MQLRTEDLNIGGMSCGHCVSAVRGALERIPGLEVVDVVVGVARVQYDPALVDRAAIVAAVAGEGYSVLSD